MQKRLLLGALLLAGLGISLTGCTSTSGLDSIAVSPATQSLTVGQTAQLTAQGTYGNAGHPSAKVVSTGVSWSSNVPSVATVSDSGVVTAVGAGSAIITASAQGFKGPVTSTATVTVTAATTGGGGGGGSTGTGTVTSLTVIPSAQTVAAPGQTTQFIAIGTTSSGATEDLTGDCAWTSSSSQIATVGASSGLASAVGAGTATITAIYSLGGGTAVTGSGTLTVSAGTSGDYTALAITPGSQALSASGQTGQLIAVATAGSGLSMDVTDSAQLTWSSSSPSVATVSATGLVTGVGVGSTTITAQLANPDNSVVLATATVSVSITSPSEALLSLEVIPSSVTVGNLQDTGQFLAIGTFSTAPYVRDLTNSVTWISTVPNVFPVSNNSNNNGQQGTENGGVVSAWGSGNAVIIAEATATDGTVQTATATFNCPLELPNPLGDPPTPGSCYPGSQGSALLSTLTVYNQGLNTSNWEITASSATGTPNVIHCGPGWSLNGGAGGSVCAATYPVGTTVTLTAPAGAGAFGGWSQNCLPTAAITADGPNSCQVQLTSDDTVGAIFN